MRHVISALVMNEPGVLAHVAGMFSARGFNIDSLVVGRTEDPKLSRMTIVVNADDVTLDQVRKQLAKLVATVNVRDFAGSAYIERDLALVTVNCNAEKRREVVEIVELFRGRVVDVAKESITVELAGTEDKLEAFIDLMQPYGIEALARTGVIAMPRGSSTVSAPDEEGGGAGTYTPAKRDSIAKPARAGSADKREPTQEELEATPPG